MNDYFGGLQGYNAYQQYGLYHGAQQQQCGQGVLGSLGGASSLFGGAFGYQAGSGQYDSKPHTSNRRDYDWEEVWRLNNNFLTTFT